VRANADNAADAARARHLGARVVGLCRTEHMFLGDRRPLLEQVILADNEADRDAALAALVPVQRQDFVELLTGDGRAAGHRAAARPAAPRVPAGPHRSCR
jgi:pyruvate,orthophosphate dikinase